MAYSKKALGIIELLQDRPVAYHPALARALGSVKEAIFLGQLLYWHGKGKRKDGWIWKTAADMEEETALSRNEQVTARKNLIKKGLLEEKRMGVPGTMHYRVLISHIVTFLHCEDSTLLEDSEQDVDDSVNYNDEKQQSIPENTIDYSESTDTCADAQPFKKRKQSDRQLALAVLEKQFSMLSGIPIPKRKTARQKKGASVRWWQPLGEIWELVGKDIDKAKRLCKLAYDDMRAANLTISAPQSILANACAEYGKRQNEFNKQEFIIERKPDEQIERESRSALDESESQDSGNGSSRSRRAFPSTRHARGKPPLVPT